MKTLIAAALAAVSLACATSAFADDVIVEAQQTVQFKPGAYGCLSKDKFDAVSVHDQAGEKQQMQQYFSGFDCLSTPDNESFRVLRVVGHDVEFVNAANSDDHGLWTSDRFIKP